MSLSSPTNTQELLTIEQFAERMGISRSTGYSWLAQGRLVQGTHVIRIGRVIRIVWDENLMDHLLELSRTEAPKPPRPRLERDGRGGRNRIALDTSLLETS